MQRLHDLLRGSSGQVCAADGAGEQGISSDEFFFGLEIKTDAAFGVAGSVQNLRGVRSGRNGFSCAHAAIDFYFSWGRDADPRGLHVEHLQQSVIVLIEQDGRAGSGAQLHRSADVVDVGVRDDDLFDLQIMFADEREHVVDVVAGIDDHRFARGFVADDRAVALQRAYGEDFVDHRFVDHGFIVRVRGNPHFWQHRPEVGYLPRL